MLLLGFRGLSVDEGSPIGPDLAAGAGGVILFDTDVPSGSTVRNIESPAQVAQLTDELQAVSPVSPLLVAIDEEGGRVARLDERHGFPGTLSAAELGARNDPAFTRTYAADLGRTLAVAGCNLDLAPVVDLNVNPDNPVIGALDRSFGANPELVIEQAQAFTTGLGDAGIVPTLKHFPGHGSSRTDSHKGFVNVTDTWSEVELEPYRTIIAGGYGGAIMTAHMFNANLDPGYPATLSHETITGLLRGELGFEGVVLSDDMQMGAIADEYGFEEAVLLAIEAGIDILTFGNNLRFEGDIGPRVTGIIRAGVESGRIPESRIDESLRRINTLRAELG